MKPYSSLSIILFILLLITGTSVFAKDEIPSGTVKGKITTNDGKPAPYVSVTIDKLNKGAVTNDEGEYIIRKVPVGSWTIKVNEVGKTPQQKEIDVRNGESVTADFELEETAAQLKEVIVNTQIQKDNSGDYLAKMPIKNIENPQVYTTVSGKMISEQMLTSVDDAMRNVTGVQSMWNATGRAGDGGSYYNSRGFTLQSNLRNGLAGIISSTADAANIESVDVLKGPSATLFGSVLTSYGGLINRVTKKPYENYGGSVTAMAGSYNFSRVAADINTPLNDSKTVLFRFNTAYNYQGTFQTEGFARRIFMAPSLLIKANDRLTFSLDAELSYGRNIGQQMFFFYFPSYQLGYDNAKQVPVDYKNSYMGDGLSQKSQSGNYFFNATYKMSPTFTSSTNVSFSHSSSAGFDPYFFLVPNAAIDPSDTKASTYIARADQSTYNNSRVNDWEVQQNFNGDFKIGSLRNRLLLGLDYTRIGSNTYFKSNSAYFDVVPINVPGFDYNGFNGTSMANYYTKYNGSDSAVSRYPSVGVTNDYSAYVSDVLNLTKALSVLAAVRVDHFDNNASGQSLKQTVWSPKFGLVYQPVLNQLSLFVNYQNSFQNGSLYNAFDPTGKDSVSSKISKPQQANQWEAGVKTSLINNKLTATLSYYDIKVTNVLRTDMRNPAFAQIQDGTQSSKGVELELNANPFHGLNVLGGFSYNDSKMIKGDSSVQGLRPTTASSPWLAHWWLSYDLPDNSVLNGLQFGFGGNYASDNKVVNNYDFSTDPTDPTKSIKMKNQFILPAYTVLNAMISYQYKNTQFGIKADNLTNRHYWTGYTTMNPQMLRQFVASVTVKF